MNIVSNHSNIFPYLNKRDIKKGIMEVQDKSFFKALLKYDILYYKDIDKPNNPSHLVFFSYYFMDKEKPIMPIINILRRTDMKVHVSPGEKLFASLTNHVISLKLKTRYSIWDYDEIFRLISIMKESLSMYDLFVLFCFVVQNYLFTFDFWNIFVSKLRYFQHFLIKNHFYITDRSNLIFFFSMFYSILSKMLLLNLYFFFFMFFSSCYWLYLIV
jgi:hypothetical protein